MEEQSYCVSQQLVEQENAAYSMFVTNSISAPGGINQYFENSGNTVGKPKFFTEGEPGFPLVP